MWSWKYLVYKEIKNNGFVLFNTVKSSKQFLTTESFTYSAKIFVPHGERNFHWKQEEFLLWYMPLHVLARHVYNDC